MDQNPVKKKAKSKDLGKIKCVDKTAPVKIFEQKKGTGTHQGNKPKGMAHNNAGDNNACTKDIFTTLNPPVHHAKGQNQKRNTEAEGKGPGQRTLNCAA